MASKGTKRNEIYECEIAAVPGKHGQITAQVAESEKGVWSWFVREDGVLYKRDSKLDPEDAKHMMWTL